MRSFIQLTTNEWLKLSKKKSFYVAFGVLTIIPIIVALFAVKIMGADLNNTDFVSFLVDITGTGTVIVILSMITAASMVAKEYQLGTIKLLLIRAHSRNKILLSKYTAMLLYTLLIFLFTIIVGYIISIIFLGFESSNDWVELLKVTLYSIIYTIIYMTISFMLSVLTKSSGATVGIAFSVMLFEGLFVMLLSRYEAAKYILFFNTDLSVYEPSNAPYIEGMTLGFSVSMLVIYMILMLGVSFITFKKRDVA